MRTETGWIRSRKLICKVLCTVFLWLASAAATMGQANPPSSINDLEKMVEPEGNFTIRVDVDEVRIDAVVLNWRGNQITDLTAEDFEIYQDGKKQEITSAIYVNEYPPPTDSINLPTSEQALSRYKIRRTLLFLVDDLSMSFQSIHHTRMGLKNYVEKQMQPGDLVGILRTSNGFGPIFSSDKRQLLAAIETIQWGTPQAIASSRCGPGG